MSGTVRKNDRVQELRYYIKQNDLLSDDTTAHDNNSNKTRVFIHPSSVLFSEAQFPYPFMVYISFMVERGDLLFLDCCTIPLSIPPSSIFMISPISTPMP